MALKISTGLATKLLGGTGEGSLQDLFAAGFIYVYKGTIPTTADASIGSATQMVKITVNNDGTTGLTFDNAVAGVLSKAAAETWSGTVGGGGGLATFYRLVPATNTTTLSTTEARIQGTIGLGGTDMVLGNTTLVAAAVLPINYFTVSIVPG